jgi:hypothetical protein
MALWLIGEELAVVVLGEQVQTCLVLAQVESDYKMIIVLVLMFITPAVEVVE